MKKIFSILILLAVVPLLLSGQVSIDPEPIKFTWHTIVLLLAGIYEVVVRIIPTVANYSFIGKVIEILLWISNFLNNKKKRK